MIVYFPALVAVIGWVLFMFCDQPPFGAKISETGRLMFFVGLFVLVLHGLSAVVK